MRVKARPISLTYVFWVKLTVTLVVLLSRLSSFSCLTSVHTIVIVLPLRASGAALASVKLAKIITITSKEILKLLIAGIVPALLVLRTLHNVSENQSRFTCWMQARRDRITASALN